MAQIQVSCTGSSGIEPRVAQNQRHFRAMGPIGNLDIAQAACGDEPQAADPSEPLRLGACRMSVTLR